MRLINLWDAYNAIKIVIMPLLPKPRTNCVLHSPVYKRKLNFELVWVPASMNRASTPVAEIGTNPQSPKFNYDIFDESTKRKIIHKPQNKSHIKVA